MIDRLDHLVLTVRDVAATRDFYVRVLGFRAETAPDGRIALLFGRQKLNLHDGAGAPILPRARVPTSGSADLCFVADRPLAEVVHHLVGAGVAIELGPVARHGALGSMRSIYLRDPDGNLLEIAEYGGSPPA